MAAVSFLSPEPDLYPPLPFAPDTPPQEIWATLWNKFYDWEYHECLSLLEGLKAYAIDQRNEDPYEGYAPYESSSTSSRGGTGRRGIGHECFEFIGYDDDDQEEDATLMIAVVEDGPCDRRLNRQWAPNPRYTTCTPLGSSIPNVGVDSNVSTAPFLRFSDDTTFDISKFQKLHDRLAWQTDFWDPDHEMIKLETVRLLHFQQGLSLQQIDELRLPTFARIRVDCVDGLIWQASQRDILFWPESQMSPWPHFTLGYVAASYSIVGYDLFSQAEHASTIFCPNYACIASSFRTCQMHGVPAIREQEPALATSEFPSGDNCGERCFQLIQDEMFNNEFFGALTWPEGTKELETVQGALKLVPDALPCDLAVICRLPCDQVYANRRRIYPDQDILDDRITDPPPFKPPPAYLDHPVEVPVIEDEIKLEFRRLPPAPCSHAGPCRKNVCSCFDEAHHCDRNCRCSRDCPNRWKGCKCKHSKRKSNRSGTNKPCAWWGDSGSNCSCVNAYRECDPELCLGCEARKGRKCGNINIQHGRFPRLEISKSQWGYGAYAVEGIPDGTWIGDYVGDIEQSNRHHKLVDITDMIHDHLKLNYTFGLTSQFAIDSMVSGNETRYLNHSENSNCSAVVVSIHNALHVILYTTGKIVPGEELFLHYGDEYWGENKEVGPASDGFVTQKKK